MTQELESQNEIIIARSMRLERLNTSLSQKEQILADTGRENAQLQRELSTIEEELSVLQEDIEERMAWLKANSELVDFGYPAYDPRNFERMVSGLQNKCTKVEANTCYINAGCLRLYNEKSYWLTYKPDETTSGEPDKLQGLASIFEQYGGDCEDYSLLFKAEYNTLKQHCMQEGAEEVVVEAFKLSDSGKFDLEYNDDEPRQIMSSESHIISGDYVYPLIVCGIFYDPLQEYGFLESNSLYQGHCVIGLTARPIETSEDIMYVKEAPLVEPQSGKYLGTLSADNKFVLLDENSYSEYMSYNPKWSEFSGIWLLITDTNIFSFAEETNSWLSYADFANDIGNLD